MEFKNLPISETSLLASTSGGPPCLEVTRVSSHSVLTPGVTSASPGVSRTSHNQGAAYVWHPSPTRRARLFLQKQDKSEHFMTLWGAGEQAGGIWAVVERAEVVHEVQTESQPCHSRSVCCWAGLLTSLCISQGPLRCQLPRFVARIK